MRAQPAASRNISRSEFGLTIRYQLRVPPGSRIVRIWVPLGSSREGQDIQERMIDIDVPYQIDEESVYGNQMATIQLENPVSGPFKWAVDYRVRLTHAAFDRPALRVATAPFLKGPRPTEDIAALAKEMIAAHPAILARAQAIYQWVIARHDDCEDLNRLFLAVSRAAGIPARLKAGYLVPSPELASAPRALCWAEFFDQPRGWQPVDVCQGRDHPESAHEFFAAFDTHKFLLSIGQELELVPRQAGESVPIFLEPYVEIDGSEFHGLEVHAYARERRT